MHLSQAAFISAPPVDLRTTRASLVQRSEAHSPDGNQATNHGAVSATSTTTTGATTSGVVPTPTEAELERISHLLELAKAGKYPGTDHVRPGRRGAIPVWSQRTAMLYYNRNQAGEPLMWLTLAMGEFKNSKTVISDKKLWMKVWEEANPQQFARIKKVSGFRSEEVTVDILYGEGVAVEQTSGSSCGS